MRTFGTPFILKINNIKEKNNKNWAKAVTVSPKWGGFVTDMIVREDIKAATGCIIANPQTQEPETCWIAHKVKG